MSTPAMTPIRHTYAVPQRQLFLYFPSQERFRFKLRKHFLNPGEPWSRLLKGGFLTEVGKKLQAGDESLLPEAYSRVVEVIDAGVQFAVNLPVYLMIEREKHGADCYYFVAEPGFKVIAYHGVIRTAYFVGEHPQASAYTLFYNSWRAIRSRALQPRREKTPGGRITEVLPRVVPEAGTVPAPRQANEFQVHMHTRANWERCPNPHPRVPHSVPMAVADWLDEFAPARGET